MRGCIAHPPHPPPPAVLLAAPGIDPTIPDEVGLTPLHYAAQRGRVEVTRQLLEAGADPRVLGNGVSVSQMAMANGFSQVADIINQWMLSHPAPARNVGDDANQDMDCDSQVRLRLGGGCVCVCGWVWWQGGVAWTATRRREEEGHAGWLSPPPSACVFRARTLSHLTMLDIRRTATTTRPWRASARWRTGTWRGWARWGRRRRRSRRR